MFELTRGGAVHLLTLNDGRDLMDSKFFHEFDEVLGQVEAASTTDAALVLTGAVKCFSNGPSLPDVSKRPQDELALFCATLMRHMGCLLVFPPPTVNVRTSILEAHRDSGIEALQGSRADRLASEDDLLPHAIEKSASLASKKREIFGQVKRALYGDLAKRLGHVRKR